jgi:hypothetical protein
MSEDYITGSEFGRWRSDHQAFQARLDSRLDAGFDGINERLDTLNGRTRKNSEDLVVLDQKVLHIAARGCGKYGEHKDVIEAIAARDPSVARPGWQDWHPAAKIGAGAGGFAVLATLMEMVNRLLQHFGL